MTTPLTKPLKRELQIQGRLFVVTLSPEGIKLVLKGKRKGQELLWEDLVSGEAALAVALNASLKGIPQPGAGTKAQAPADDLGPPAANESRALSTPNESAASRESAVSSKSTASRESRGAGKSSASNESAAAGHSAVRREKAAKASNNQRNSPGKARASSRTSKAKPKRARFSRGE